MRVISMMEMNAKSPFIWDWENLVVFNTKTIEAPKKLRLVDSEIEGIEGFEVGSYFSGGTASDLGYASSSRSSKSASVESSPDKQDVINKRELVNSGITQTSSTIESSVASGESLIALELGKRTYFEDVYSKNAAKKSKLSTPHSDIPRCQVEGCNLDLSSAKDYHRKHKVCENHSKCPRVVINGLERRFCQQCSRFHSLTEFDQKKRSCRRRLSDHNARRRKPKPEVIQFNSMRLPPLLYEGRNQLSFAFNQGSALQSRGDVWDATNNSKVAVKKPSVLTIETRNTDELHSIQNGLQIPETKVSNVSTHLLPSKSSSFEAYQRGIAVSVKVSNMEAAQDQQRALSLLSTTSWGSCDPHPATSSILPNQPSLCHPFPVAQPESLPISTTEYWQVEEAACGGVGSHGSSFQLFKTPNDPSFYLY